MGYCVPPELRVLAPRTQVDSSADSVAAIGDAILPDGAQVFCIENQSNYRLVRSSASEPDGSNILPTVSGLGRWHRELGIVELEFVGSVELVLDRDAWAVYRGAVQELVFSVAPAGHSEQRVQSYRIPAGTATSLVVAPEANLTQIEEFNGAADYLLIFSYFSGRVVGTGRTVTS